MSTDSSPDAAAASGTVVCFGEMLLRLGTAPGHDLVGAAAFEPVIGGAEANVAVALSALGHHCRMATVLPANPLGERALAALRAAGVDTTAVARRPGRMGLYFLAAGASLRPAAITYDRDHSAFATCPPEASDFAAALRGADLLHLSGITAALGPNGLALARAAVAAARAAGLRISFDPNYRESLWRAWDSDPRGALAELIEAADVLFAGHRDIALLTGQTFEGEDARAAVAEAAFARFPRLTVLASTTRETVTQSHHRLAARVDTPAGHHQTEAIDVTDIVDRIGSGDAFAAGVLHAWRHGGDVRAMAWHGLALGALSHGVHGDFCRITPAELAAFAGTAGDVRR